MDTSTVTGTVGGPVAAPGSVVYLRGELDVLSAPHLRWRLAQEVHHPRHQAVIVDLSRVTFIDCAGLGPLLAARATLAGRLRLRGPPWAVVRLLRLTGTTASFTIIDPVDGMTGQDAAAAVARVRQISESTRRGRIIERATGLLMGTHRCDAAQAARLMRQVSASHLVSVADLASALTLTASDRRHVVADPGMTAALTEVLGRRAPISAEGD